MQTPQDLSRKKTSHLDEIPFLEANDGAEVDESLPLILNTVWDYCVDDVEDTSSRACKLLLEDLCVDRFAGWARRSFAAVLLFERRRHTNVPL